MFAEEKQGSFRGYEVIDEDGYEVEVVMKSRTSACASSFIENSSKTFF